MIPWLARDPTGIGMGARSGGSGQHLTGGAVGRNGTTEIGICCAGESVMTLHQVVVVVGVLLSFALLAVLAALWPAHRARVVLSMTRRPDALRARVRAISFPRRGLHLRSRRAGT